MFKFQSRLNSLHLQDVVDRFPTGFLSIFGFWVVIIVMYAAIDNLFSMTPTVKEALLYHLSLASGWFLLNASLLSALELAFGLTAEAGNPVAPTKQRGIKALVVMVNTLFVLSVFPLSYMVFHSMSGTQFSGVMAQKYSYILGYAVITSSLVLLSGAPPSINKSKQLFYLWYSLFFTTVVVGFLSVVAMVGAGIAIGTIQLFFKINFSRFLVYLSLTISSLIAPLLGLSLLPTPKKLYKADFNLHAIYSFFVTKIVATLVMIYLGLLYIYALKQVLIAQWPENGVVYTILGLLIPVVIFTVLYFPEKYVEKKRNALRGLFTRGIYFLSIPMVGMYLLSIGVRVLEYGITIPRYLVFTLGVFLLIFNIYWAVAKKPKLAFIPLLAIVITLLTVFTPGINIFSVSQRSQLGRLEKKLNELLLLNPERTKLQRPPTEADKNVIDFSAVRYLQQFHATPGLLKQKPYLTELANMNVSENKSRVNFTFEDDVSSENFITPGAVRVFPQTIGLYERYDTRKSFINEEGKTVDMKFHLDKTGEVRLDVDGETLYFELQPLLESLKPIWSKYTTTSGYGSEHFPKDVQREVSVEDAKNKYTLYISRITFEFPPSSVGGDVKTLQQVLNTQVVLMVTKK